MESEIILKPHTKFLAYIFVPLFGLSLLANILAHNSLERPLLVILFLSVVLIALYLFIAQQKIILYKDCFSYNNGQKKITVPWQSITRSEITFNKKWREPMLQLFTSDESFYYIRLSLYPKKSIQLFIQNLLLKSVKANHSKEIMRY